MERLIKFLLAEYTIPLILLGVGLLAIDLWFDSSQNWVEATLFWFLLIPVAGFFLYPGILHIFRQDLAASHIGWEPSPFETEVGISDVGFGVMAALAAFYGYDVKLVYFVGMSIFMWGAAIGHIKDMIVNKNFSPGNAGIIFWSDLLLPVFGWSLLLLSSS